MNAPKTVGGAHKTDEEVDSPYFEPDYVATPLWAAFLALRHWRIRLLEVLLVTRNSYDECRSGGRCGGANNTKTTQPDCKRSDNCALSVLRSYQRTLYVQIGTEITRLS